MVRKMNNKVKALNHNEPFTKNEKKVYDNQEQNFIRGIQISQGVNKKSGIKLYKDYLTGNLVENKKKFRKRAANALKGEYGKHLKIKGGKKKKISVKSQRVLKNVPAKKQKLAGKIKKEMAIRKAKRKTDSYSPSMKQRILRASKMYPNDSLYQWQHGHNAKR